jgi:hypothetical protein
MSISEVDNNFRLLVLDVVKHDVIPELRKAPNSKILVEKAMRYLTKTLGWQTPLSIKEDFFFAILSTYCTNIPISRDDFKWVQYYKESNLGLVFSDFCRWNEISVEECVMAVKLQERLQVHSSEYLKRYVL